MSMRQSMWARWKAFAQRAAEVQANVLFFLLYYVAIVPMGLFGLGGTTALKRTSDAPVWTAHDRTPSDLRSSRRQF